MGVVPWGPGKRTGTPAESPNAACINTYISLARSGLAKAVGALLSLDEAILEENKKQVLGPFSMASKYFSSTLKFESTVRLRHHSTRLR